MKGTTMTNEREALERVGKAIRDARTMDEYHSGDIDMGHLTDAAIAEYNAWLWSRADDPEVVERFAVGLEDSYQSGDTAYEMSRTAITALLTALIGPRPQGESDER